MVKATAKALAAVAVLSLTLVSCGKGADGSLRDVVEAQLKMMEEFASAMDKAQNADQVAAALEQHAKQVEKLAPRVKALAEKHPELAGMGASGQLPAELKEYEAKIEAAATKMMGAMGKMMQYGEDPKVQAAMERIEGASQKMQ
ncbi:MAG: hypothetical protein GXY85_12140 [Candidatus Brocadiaceae bacterium]|nr:hypothetical protein [Candidatus Brocadiaceae bacterium]